MTSSVRIIKTFILLMAVIIPLAACIHAGNAQTTPVPHSAMGAFVSQSRNATVYSVTFHEYGLPSGMKWSVTLNGTTLNTTGVELSFAAINGSYQYQVGSENGYYGPSLGVIQVNGHNASRSLTFKPINTPYETIQLFFEGAGLGGIIGGTAASMFVRRKNN